MNKVKVLCHQQPNGIYLVFADGSYVPFDPSHAIDEEVKYIGIIHEGHPFCVALRDAGEYPLLRSAAKCEGDSPYYLRSECEALNEWECEERTKRIQQLGTDIPLNEGEMIPSLPMLVAMRYWKKRGLDDALTAAGGEPMSASYYWSVSECNSSYAWGVYFGSGLVYGNYCECYGFVVRPVAAFNL